MDINLNKVEKKTVDVYFAKDYLSYLIPKDRKESAVHKMHEGNYEQLDIAIKALEEVIKHRWHDLRVDSDDKPDNNRFVEVRTEDSFPYYFGWYDEEHDWWFDSAGFSMNPYKWREIEEEVSE